MVTDHNKMEDVTKGLAELNHIDMISSSHVAFHAHPHLTLRVYNTFFDSVTQIFIATD